MNWYHPEVIAQGPSRHDKIRAAIKAYLDRIPMFVSVDEAMPDIIQDLANDFPRIGDKFLKEVHQELLRQLGASANRTSRHPEAISQASATPNPDMSMIERGIQLPSGPGLGSMPPRPEKGPSRLRKRPFNRKRRPWGSLPLGDLRMPLRSQQALPNSAVTQDSSDLMRASNKHNVKQASKSDIYYHQVGISSYKLLRNT